MTKFKLNLIAGIIAAIYLIVSTLPLIGGLLSTDKKYVHKFAKKDNWVEDPMMIEV